ncbi:MAG TPA: CHAT domain-containing tetratricopeptide repeat protein [Thermoanaerobaculia bacterium]|jgi:CHAT domain-containing protein/tetratricopeptide (TPR) repeat protein|nr:CHAT domain-containing tetratricopeptide repeat protein [Thermoanaerobaculia bacterium]
MSVLTLLAFLGTSALAANAAPPAEAVATPFVRALASGDMDALEALSTAEATASPDWQLLRNTLETYDCVSIASHEVIVEGATETESTLVVVVRATAFARGATRTPLRFPHRWRLEAVRAADGWKLRSILAEEHVIARRLAARSDLTAEMIVAAARDADLEAVLVRLGEDLYRSPIAGKSQALQLIQSVARSEGTVFAEVVTLRLQAMLAVFEKRFAEGVDKIREAREVAEASGIADARAVALLASGTLVWQSNFPDEALQHYDAAAALMEEADDPRASMKALYMRGGFLIQRGALRDVVISSAALAQSAARFEWTEGRCIAAFQRSSLYGLLQDVQTGRHYAAEALECSESLRNPQHTALALADLAQSERAAGNIEASERLMRRTLPKTPGDKSGELALAAMRIDLGQVLTEAERYDAAVTEVESTLPILHKYGEKMFEADALRFLAHLRLLQGRHDEALRLAEDADAIIRNASNVVGFYRDDPSWSVRATLGRALRAVGRLPEATAALQSSIELIESRRTILGTDELMVAGFMRDKANPYGDLVSLLVERGRLRDAVVASERFRARALATAIARGHVDRLPAMTDAERERHDKLNETIAELNRKLLASGDDPSNAALRERLTAVRVEQREFLNTLYASRPDIRARNIDDPQTIVDDSRRLLPRSDEALLTFSVHDAETFVFYLERSGDDLTVNVHRVAIRRKELEERVRAFGHQIERRDLQYRRSGGALYELLVAPFAARIGSKRLLTIVPDGLLWSLPFQALQAPGGKHLIERVAVAYAPSLTLLRNDRREDRRSVASGTVLAIADPILPPTAENAVRAEIRGASLAPLPDARTEVLAIAKMYGSESRTLIGSNATETAAKKLAADFPVLHLATHGVIDDVSPMYSAIILGATEKDDGLLEAREMMDLHLGADLAILSACDSASGDLTPGEGIIGMSWALMVAGCRNTVVSQWKVDSASTAQLMIAFHRQIRSANADYAEAMRQAQLALLRDERFSHPYYWSPFVLISTSQ